MPGNLEYVSRNNGTSLQEVRTWAKAFPDLAPLMESLGALHDERTAARTEERRAKQARRYERTRRDTEGKQRERRGMSLLDLERRLAKTTGPSHEGPKPMVTLSEAWKVGATTAELSVHAIGCTWLGQQGMVNDRFHIHRLIPEPELMELAEHADIDERCLCRRPRQAELFAQSPRPSLMRSSTANPATPAGGQNT
ncbi:hypothetical protein [Nonomuraea sp. NPDC049784]|uniref:hypothetical protein n=1 Tax=Nonomuraea sp. NPDC049784 TaxID=3154361 RepID=UPI0033FB5EDB